MKTLVIGEGEYSVGLLPYFIAKLASEKMGKGRSIQFDEISGQNLNRNARINSKDFSKTHLLAGVIMCNAWNHSPSCTCGWGGSGSTGGGGRYGLYKSLTYHQISSDSSHFDSLVQESQREERTYKTKCWYCGEEVFYHTNGYGDCVLFDDLGAPWPIHSCWLTYCRAKGSSYSSSKASSLFSPMIVDLADKAQKDILLKGVLQSLKAHNIPPTLGKVAEQLGKASISDFVREYQGLFYEDNGLVNYGFKKLGDKQTTKSRFVRSKKYN